jgi:hypothetical protein
MRFVILAIVLLYCSCSFNDPKVCFQHSICDWANEGKADREKRRQEQMMHQTDAGVEDGTY